jgi:pimeloyl-ACP methyl ester carboxylesterase
VDGTPELREVRMGERLVLQREVGEGRPLVLLHGLAGSWRWWSPLFPALADGRRLYVPELPRPPVALPSDAMGSWVLHWLDAAGLEQVDLAAHSLGGLFAAELAAVAPERVSRLVLVAPAGIPCGRSLPGRVLPLTTALLDIRRRLPMVVGDAVRTGPVALARDIALVDRRDLREELSEISAPTLLVWGERDRLVPSRLAGEWQRLIPQARLVLLDCGHVPMLEAPDELAGAMRTFLDR